MLVASHHVWSWLDVHWQLDQPLLRQEPRDARSESSVRLRAGFGVRTTFLLGGDIRQKLLPLFRSVPKPGFRSAKGFLPSLMNLNTGRGKTKTYVFCWENYLASRFASF